MVSGAGATWPVAVMGGQIASDLIEVTADLSALAKGGRWAVALPYSGPPVLARFGSWTPGCARDIAGPWHGPKTWIGSTDRQAYIAGVNAVRHDIRRGRVYQANLCRIMSADLDPDHPDDIAGLHALVETQHEAPYAAMLRLPEHGVHISSASPELFLAREGDRILSGPIKGTARTVAGLQEKDRAENIMIVDLVRNDFGHLCVPGSVEVPALLRIEQHPGLVHLVSDVSGVLRAELTWSDILAATFPPGSVTGAPRHTATQVIEEQEQAPRDFYCGAVGWIDTDTQEAQLAVGIRTFWKTGHRLHFGTGAGITWGSDAATEWSETCLKAERLTRIAAGHWAGAGAARDAGQRVSRALTKAVI
ncbi:MAG: chorismate-binding protein [Candidatus Nanopelagicales bacterium]